MKLLQFVVPVDDTQDVVEVSGTTLKGLKAGEFKFTVTSGELAPSDEMTLVVDGETTTPDEYTLVGEYKWDLGADFSAAENAVSTDNAESFSTVLLEKNTIANQTEIISFEVVNKAYYDKDKGAIKLGTSKVDGSFKINTVNQIKKIELTAYLRKDEKSSDIVANNVVETLSVTSNPEGKTTGTVEIILSEASNALTISSSKRIVITNIKLYK